MSNWINVVFLFERRSAIVKPTTNTSPTTIGSPLPPALRPFRPSSPSRRRLSSPRRSAASTSWNAWKPRARTSTSTTVCSSMTPIHSVFSHSTAPHWHNTHSIPPGENVHQKMVHGLRCSSFFNFFFFFCSIFGITQQRWLVPPRSMGSSAGVRPTPARRCSKSALTSRDNACVRAVQYLLINKSLSVPPPQASFFSDSVRQTEACSGVFHHCILSVTSLSVFREISRE